MQKPLLTQGQASKLLSFAVVLIFTVLLIVSGIVIQQRTVGSIRTTLRPRIDSPAVLAAEGKHSGAHEPSLSSHSEFDPHSHSAAFNFISKLPLLSLLTRVFPGGGHAIRTKDAHPIRWSKTAYAQTVTQHEDLCSAVMLFSDLHKQGSLPGRVLVFPDEWIRGEATLDPQLDGESTSSTGKTESNAKVKQSVRLLRRAAREFRVTLVPYSATSLDRTDHIDAGSDTALHPLFSLSRFDKLMLLPRPGLIQDAETLDSLIGYAEIPEGGYATVGINSVRPELGLLSSDGREEEEQREGDEESVTSAIVLLHPWSHPPSSSKEKKKEAPRLAIDSTHSLAHLPDQWNIPSSRIFSWTGRLKEYHAAQTLRQQQQQQQQPEGHVGTHQKDYEEGGHRVPKTHRPPLDLLSSAYILLSDRNLPGPEYLIDKDLWESAIPTGFQDRRVWQAVYRRWRRRRMDVCGEGLIKASSTGNEGVDGNTNPEAGGDTRSEL